MKFTNEQNLQYNINEIQTTNTHLDKHWIATCNNRKYNVYKMKMPMNELSLIFDK